ncbi:Hypothetical protein LUCI_3678 [Lucifera butyrica]|uniref:Isochorismatase-like domain-containing protein n=1 Tax=Lucifera butyrica TaxID=1351585 RepID=A0A498R9X0_9FIRM|nr:hypothetical protein [Lucifera butyrica]VBB08334.1 Hypothetical protein LUCI_3605 [Lucifera butyrica]VBB08406.1 Hypothetical protein LUCI_3678 [Lucifera butyrica]
MQKQTNKTALLVMDIQNGIVSLLESTRFRYGNFGQWYFNKRFLPIIKFIYSIVLWHPQKICHPVSLSQDGIHL